MGLLASLICSDSTEVGPITIYSDKLSCYPIPEDSIFKPTNKTSTYRRALVLLWCVPLPILEDHNFFWGKYWAALSWSCLSEISYIHFTKSSIFQIQNLNQKWQTIIVFSRNEWYNSNPHYKYVFWIILNILWVLV